MASLLYVRSVYSLLSSMCTIPRRVKMAKEKGYSSIGLVDKNVLSGAMSFYNECLKENVDYERVHRNLEKIREQSYNYLRKALEDKESTDFK